LNVSNLKKKKSLSTSNNNELLKNSLIKNTARSENYFKSTISINLKKEEIENTLLNKSANVFQMKKTQNNLSLNKNFKNNFLSVKTINPTWDNKSNNSPMKNLAFNNLSPNKKVNNNNLFANLANKEGIFEQRRNTMISPRIEKKNISEMDNNPLGFLKKKNTILERKNSISERKNSFFFGNLNNKRNDNMADKSKQKFNHPKGMKILQKVNHNLKMTHLNINHPGEFYSGLFIEILKKENKNEIRGYKKNLKSLDKIYTMLKTLY